MTKTWWVCIHCGEHFVSWAEAARHAIQKSHDVIPEPQRWLDWRFSEN